MKKLVLLITVILLLTGCEISFSTNTDNFDNAYFKDVVNCVRENVNMGKNVQFYEEGALLLIPISSRNACSPDFNDSSYKYAFVGLTYNNEYYRYFVYVSNQDSYGFDEEYLNKDLTYKMVSPNGTLATIYANKNLLNKPTDKYNYGSDHLPTVMNEYRTQLIKYDVTESFEKK